MGDAAALAERSAHPHDVMIAPLNIDRMMIDKGFHNRIGMRATVVNVAYDVQSLNGQTLNQPAQRLNECRPPTSSHNSVDDSGVICLFIKVTRIGVHKLFDDVREVFRQGFANAGTSVFTRSAFTNGNQTRQHFSVPHSLIRNLRKLQTGFLPGVINQRCERALFFLRKLIAKHVIDLQANRARTISKDMGERLIFAMNIGSEEFRALRQIKNRAQIYNLGGRFCDRGKRARKKFEIALFSSIHTQASLTNRLQQQLDFQTVGFMVPREKESRPYRIPNGIFHRRKGETAHGAYGLICSRETRKPPFGALMLQTILFVSCLTAA